MSRDGALGIAGLLLAGAYYRIAADVPESMLSDAVGPSGLPKIYAVVLGALSLILVGRSLAAVAGRSRAARPLAGLEDGYAIARPAGLLALGVAYLFMVPYAGYLLSIAMLIAATTCFQGKVMRPAIVAVSIGGAVFFWLLFVRLLGVAHPPGIWPSLL